MAATGFLLIRHGTVDYDQPARDRFRGHGIDMLPLTPTGVDEAEALAEKLLGMGIDLIVSSPMTRALQTAMIASWALHVDVQVELDLHEWVPDLDQQWTTGVVPMAA